MGSAAAKRNPQVSPLKKPKLLSGSVDRTPTPPKTRPRAPFPDSSGESLSPALRLSWAGIQASRGRSRQAPAPLSQSRLRHFSSPLCPIFPGIWVIRELRPQYGIRGMIPVAPLPQHRHPRILWPRLRSIPTRLLLPESQIPFFFSIYRGFRCSPEDKESQCGLREGTGNLHDPRKKSHFSSSIVDLGGGGAAPLRVKMLILAGKQELGLGKSGEI